MPSTGLVHLLQLKKMYVKGRCMYVEVGIDVGRAGDKVLSVSAPVLGGWGVVKYLHPKAFP